MTNSLQWYYPTRQQPYIDSKGNVIQKLTGKDNKDSEPITDKEAPKFLKDAIIAIEDERFETHPGIDFRRIFSAGLSYSDKQRITHAWRQYHHTAGCQEYYRK